MKTRRLTVIVITVVLSALYMIVPACGNPQNGNVSTVPYGTLGYGTPGYGTTGVVCQPGQVCPTGVGGVQGVPLVPGPVIAVLDSFGSTATMTFGGTSVVAGQMYNGMVNITGVVNMMPGGLCPPGSYQLSGQGTWAGNYGATLGQVTANLQMSGPGGMMQAQTQGLVYAGQDPDSPVPTQFYLAGLFPTTCNPGGVAE